MTLERRIAETEGLIKAISKRIETGQGSVADIAVYERHVNTLLDLQRRYRINRKFISEVLK